MTLYLYDFSIMPRCEQCGWFAGLKWTLSALYAPINVKPHPTQYGESGDLVGIVGSQIPHGGDNSQNLIPTY